MAFIQVRNVDEELREAAKQRAAALGLDLSSYVRRLIERDLARPTMSEWLDNVLAHPVGQPFDAAAAVREVRRERDAQIG
jgi:plasmid stability protein